MKNKRILIIFIIAMLIAILGTTVKGGNTFKATVSPTEKTLKPGEEFSVTISVSDINMGEKGINTLEGKIEYDKTIFEEVKSSAIQNLNNWTTTYNDESSNLNGKFLSVNMTTNVKEKTQILSVKFKVKSDVKENKDTQINFKDLTSNDGQELINAGTKTVTVKINATSSNPSTPDTSVKNEIKDETIDNKKDESTDNKQDSTKNNVENLVVNKVNQTNQTSKNNILDNTQSATKIPNAGKSSVVAISLVIFLIVVIFVGIKYRKMKDVK